MTRRPWPKAETEKAIKLSSEGLSAAEIGVILNRTEDAVGGHLKSRHSMKPGVGLIPCRKCRRDFKSPDKKKIRFCNKRRQDNREAYDNTVCLGGLI